MVAKKLLLASLGIMSICSAVQAEQWGRVRCLRECTDTSCADASKMEICEQNCAAESLEACKTAKAQPSQPTVLSSSRPRSGPRALPTLPVIPSTSKEQQSALPRPVLPLPSAEQTQPPRPPRPVTPTPVESSEQVQPSRSRPGLERRQAQIFEKPPVLGGAGQENVEPGQAVRGLRQSGSQHTLQKQPSGHRVGGADGDKESYTLTEINSLLKGMLKDKYKEVTTGCDSAIRGATTGLDQIKDHNSPESLDLRKRGTGFIAIFVKEKQDALERVEAFSIDLRLPIEEIKEMYAKAGEKSLLAAQDCKVKTEQFNGWLKDYWANYSAKNKKK